MEKTIQESVAEKISTSGQNVANVVIEKLADVEIQRRVDLIIKCVQKQEALEKELKKIDKNDVVMYNGTTPSEAMSKERFDKIKKDKEKIAKLVGAINTALTSNTTESYNKLTETLKKLDNAGNNKPDSSEDSE